MSKFLNSLKSDLLDRRLMPLLALFAVGLIAAIAYAALAGSGSSTAPTASAPPVVPVAGIAISAVKPESEAGAGETTSGVPKHGASSAHNPFTPLSEPKAKGAATTSSSSSSAAKGGSQPSPGSSGAGTSESGSSGSPGSGSSGSGGQPSSGSTTPAKKKPQPKSEIKYAVAVLLGTAAPGTPAPNAALTLYQGLELQQPLPSSQQPLIVYRGVIDGVKSAAFTLVGEVIPHGNAQCLPSPTQCQAITLKPGETEELDYVPLGGTAVNYELYVVAIKRSNAPLAKGASVRRSAAGLTLLRNEGLERIPGLRYSAGRGVLVSTSHRAFAARVNAASTSPARAHAAAPGAALIPRARTQKQRSGRSD